ncbi:MAG: hypothetical protein JWP89_5219 [Schlesneria sp.]|nr:hypothetical protein [Schlesneria sp.]
MTTIQCQRKTLEELLESITLGELPAVTDDIAERNLLCATGLPGSQSLDIDAALARIDEMAYRVNAEIRRNYHRFVANPAEGDNSQAKYCVLMMVTVLQQDFGVQYNPDRIRTPDFRDAGDLFIHGMLSGNGGTCASMPVLYTAVGRRLGWPMKLSSTLSHFFCRWDDPNGRHLFGKERFNLEGSGQGAHLVSDDYYRTWPRPISDELIEGLGYLKSLTPAEETAAFLALRGHCLEDNGRIAKACDAYFASSRLAPTDRIYKTFWECADLLRERLIERQTLLDYFGPDVPLPFGYFPRHVLRQMAADMAFAECEYFNLTQRLEREQFEARFRTQVHGGISNRRLVSQQNAGKSSESPYLPSSLPHSQLHAGFDATGLPIPPGIAGLSSYSPDLMGINSVFPTANGPGNDSLPAKVLRTIDPQCFAMRRQEAVAIAKSLPKDVAIRQPRRRLLTPPNQSRPIQSQEI